MAVIEGATTASLLDVDPSGKGLWAAAKPKDARGAYGVCGNTGILPAALASGSVLWGMRNGPTSGQRLIVTRMLVRLYVRTAASAFTDVSVELVRFSGANFTGGVVALPINKRPNGVAATNSATLTAGTEGGDNRIATTSALGTAGVTFDPNTYNMVLLPVISVTVPAAGTMVERSVENDAGLEHPIELSPGEGICYRTVGAIPTGMTLMAQLAASWSERV